MSDTNDDAAPGPAEKPFLTVVSGNPSDEEVAALVSVLAAAGGDPGPLGPVVRNDWGLPTDMHRPQWGMPTTFTNRG
ncbi:acyl-CoA carboxylase epsilon subunit [Gordonia zhaorongruii]|uniref:acyl-CoA carboxylase epsilon subunit n=1 Tax=Gordonia zhaorongruii TaxID=2597659 RepID=UPI001F3B433E|nr:acyl-CoA carboxylase epsilon subunit [Gordonia zhaorongruii]